MLSLVGESAFAQAVESPPWVTAGADADGLVTLSWGDTSAPRYEVEQRIDGGSWFPIASPNDGATTLQIPMTVDGLVELRVRSCNGEACGVWVLPISPVTVVVPVFPSYLSGGACHPPPEPVPAQEHVGTIPGAPGVANGGATYEVPIEVAPGRRGMSPALAFSYTSRGGDDLLGVGWTISGLSRVHRCDRIAAIDGAFEAVAFDSADALCLDGQRLTDAGTAPDGSPQFRTEIDNYDRITMTSGQMGFVVERKSGIRDYYGADQGQLDALEQVSPGVTSAWWLKRSVDRQGNNILYSYRVEGGQFVPDRIDYTGRGSTIGNRHVQFGYAPRPDPRTVYQRGYPIQFTRVLSSVTTLADSKLVRAYQLSYAPSRATGRPLLKSVEACASTSPNVCLPPTTFEYQDEAHTFQIEQAVQDLPSSEFEAQRVKTILTRDYDGDGQKDLVRLEYAAAGDFQVDSLEARLSAGGSIDLQNLEQTLWFDRLLMAETERAVDIDSDGFADFLGTANGQVIMETFLPGGAIRTRATNIYVDSTAWLRTAMDFNGDGRIDLLFKDATIYFQCPSTGNDLDFCRSTTIDIDLAEEAILSIDDFDGNGRPDFFIDALSRPGPVPPHIVSRIVFAFPAGANLSLVSHDLSDLGGPSGTFREYGELHAPTRFFDLNGDGLSDIYRLHDGITVWLNTGAIGPGMFSRILLNDPAGGVASRYRSAAIVADYDLDGRDEILVPSPTDLIVPWCWSQWNYECSGSSYSACANGYEAPGHQSISSLAKGLTAERSAGECSVPLANTPCESDGFIDRCSGGIGTLDFTAASSGRDRSIHGWEAIEIVLGPTGFEVRREPPSVTGIVLPMHAAGPADYHGDGLPDFEFRLANLWGELRHGNQPLGFHSGSLPPGWGNGPRVAKNTGPFPDLMVGVTNGLGATAQWSHSALSSEGNETCVSPVGLRFYDKTPGTDLDPTHILFASSLHVVSRFDVSNGVGGENGTCYRYRNATFDNFGRGFLGFEQTIAEEALGDGHDVRTIHTYHLDFPLTGRLSRVSRSVATDLVQELPNGLVLDVSPLDLTLQNWQAECAPRTYGSYASPDTTCRVRLFASAEETRDPLGSRPILSTTLTTTEYDIDDAPYGNVSSIERVTSDAFGVYRTVTDYDYTYDESSWWIDRLDRVTVTSDPVQYRTLLFPNIPGNTAKITTTDYEYYSNGHPWSRLRRVIEEQAGSAFEWKRVDFGRYDGYGNLEESTATAAGAAFPRTAVDTYGADGYFVDTKTNALGHQQTNSQIDPKTGTVLLSKKGMSSAASLETTRDVDLFGHLVQVGLEGQAPTDTRRLSCDSSCPPGTVYRSLEIRQGAPAVWTYYDVLERAVATRTTAFEASAAILTFTQYDARGRVVAVSEPEYEAGFTGHWTRYEDFDVRGRPGRKIRDLPGYRSFDAGGALVPDETFVTEYTYSGQIAEISVDGRITLIRATDVFGRVVESVDSAGTPTSMRYDAGGQLVFAQVNGANAIFSIYDDLGRRIAFSDPDRGTWALAYNGFGELIWQRDANGTDVTFEYDQLGRMTVRRVNGVSQARWSYDARGSGLPDREETYLAGSVDLSRDFYYDALFRKNLERTAFDGKTFDVKTAYDCNGRVYAQEFPNGEAVEFEFGPSGHLVSERNPRFKQIPPGGVHAIGQLYREVRGYSARNVATFEAYGNETHQFSGFREASGQMDRGEVQALRGGSLQTVLLTEYDFNDGLMNLTSRSRTMPFGMPTHPEVQAAHEDLEYDALQRLRRSTTTWSVTSGPARTPRVVDYDYDVLGNLTKKTDYVDEYGYGDSARENSANAGPHAVTSIRKANGLVTADFSYDHNGNQLTGDGRVITYSFSNRPTKIVENGTTTEFFYGPSGELYKQTTGATTTRYVAGVYEEVEEGSITEQRAYAGASVIVAREVRGPTKRRWLHRDRLGSTELVTDEDGEVVEAHCFSPFGSPLSSICDVNGDELHSGEFAEENGHRGFTGHEHLDQHRLIHMNGRVYDPRIGRFLSTDPIVQLPEVSQNWNPYTYIMNNPFSAVDPSGYSFMESVKDSVAGVGDFLEANLPSSDDAKLMVTGWAVGGPVGIAVAGGVLFAKSTVGGAIDTANATVDAFQREGLAGALYEVNERLNPAVGMLEHGSEFLNAAKTGDVRTAVREGLETTKAAVGMVAVASGVKDRLVGSASGQRAGKAFTKKGKAEIDGANAERNGGVNVCESCGTEVVEGKRSQRGVSPPGNERQRDHIVPKSKGGDGDPSNGQVLCRDCNLEKSDKV